MTMDDTHIRHRISGRNQSGLRDQNARLVLSYLRRYGDMPSAEIARRSGLSAQTVSNITRALEADRLIEKREVLRGKVGKPSVPVGLRPEGVYAFGMNIGRRSLEVVLVDFSGNEVERARVGYRYPAAADVFSVLDREMATMLKKHPQARDRLAGLGVASPSKLWSWLEIVSAPEQEMQKWQDISLPEVLAERTGLEVFVENDATSACIAENLGGLGSETTNFAYIFMGAFVGGGLVLDGDIVSGSTHNAAAFGPLPVPDGKGGVTELLNVASLYNLEAALRDRGIDPDGIRYQDENWQAYEEELVPWIEQTAESLALASAAIASIVEVEVVVVDGVMPTVVRQRLTDGLRTKFAGLALTKINEPRFEPGTIGKGARSYGAALMPIYSRYFVA